MSDTNTKAAVEALLFMSQGPLEVNQIKKILEHLDAAEIRQIIQELKTEFEATNRGVRIYEVAGGYQIIAAAEFASFVRKLYNNPQADKLSKQALETLAIIAYKQPVTKLEIESLRKVNVDGVMASLLEKNLIRIAGIKKAPGNPKVYGTTRQFLEYFGLNSLDDLPKLDKEQLSVPEGVAVEVPAPDTTKGEQANDTTGTTLAH